MPLTASNLSLNALVRADVMDFWDVDERDDLNAEAPTRLSSSRLQSCLFLNAKIIVRWKLS